MKRNSILTPLLLLGCLNFSSINNIHAMDAQVVTGQEPTQDQEFRTTILFVERNCFDLMNQGERASCDANRIPFYAQTLDFLKTVVDPYRVNFQDTSFSTDDRVFAIESIYRISQMLYQKWTKTVNINSREAQTAFWPTFQYLCDINQLTITHLTFLPLEKLTSINPNLARYNTLVNVSTLFANRIKYLQEDEINRHYILASVCYDILKNIPQYKEQAKNHIIILKTQKEESEKSVRRTKLGKKGKLFLKQQEFIQQEQLLQKTKKAQEGFQAFNPTVTFMEVVTLKNQASTIWDSTKDIKKYIEAQRKTYQTLVELERNIARELGIERDTEQLTVEDYTNIYTALVKAVTFEAAKTRLPEFMIISQNCSDFEKSLVRLTACARVLGSAGDDFDSMPNSLKHIFATLKYCQGEPQYWDRLNDKLELERQKKREARNKKKNAHTAQVIKQVIKDDLEEKKLNAAKEQPQRPLTMSAPPAAVVSPEPFSPSQYAFEVGSEPNETASIKKSARELLRKREEKGHVSQASPPSAVAPKTAKGEEVAIQRVSVDSLLKGNALKLYQSLYCETPKLISEEAVQLLGACGLVINKKEGKGSHTKGTLIAGETIKDRYGKVIWTCPDLGEDSMMIVPKWDGKDIPNYMIKNLRYILEKMGINPAH